MSLTIIEQLANFAADASYDALPQDVVHESKRIVLDSIGCALAALDNQKGRIGIEFGRRLGGGMYEATVIGTGEQLNVFGAAFANSELINALDYDIVLPPGHVTPYVLPGILAVGESVGASGKEVIVANAIAHEMTNRMGKAMDNLRDTKDGKFDPPDVFGYSSSIFGAAAGAVRLKGGSREVQANALSIAANITPVNYQMAYNRHMPPTTIKYLLGGEIAQASLTAALLAELGHRGALQVLDDREFGYARYIGTKRWYPERILDELGARWGFPPELSYKPFPNCRAVHAQIGCMTRVLEEHDIKPEEIEKITIFVEGFGGLPIWTNRDIIHVTDAQFSIPHIMAVAAHRPPEGKAWQAPELIFSESVKAMMDKVDCQIHPDYVKLLEENRASRPARVIIKARGQVFEGEQRYPKGSKTPEATSYMTDDELIQKFGVNAEGVLPSRVRNEVVDAIMNLERVADIGSIMRKLGHASVERPQRRVAAS